MKDNTNILRVGEPCCGSCKQWMANCPGAQIPNWPACADYIPWNPLDVSILRKYLEKIYEIASLGCHNNEECGEYNSCKDCCVDHILLLIKKEEKGC